MTAEKTDSNSSDRHLLNLAVSREEGAFVPHPATRSPLLLSLYSGDPHGLQAEASHGPSLAMWITVAARLPGTPDITHAFQSLSSFRRNTCRNPPTALSSTSGFVRVLRKIF
jgi:hypothetical protein